MSLAEANDTRFRQEMWISRKNGSSVDACRRARKSLGRLGKILGKNRNWPGVLCGTCGNRKICPRFHIGGESSGANGSNFPQLPRIPHSETCSAHLSKLSLIGTTCDAKSSKRKRHIRLSSHLAASASRTDSNSSISFIDNQRSVFLLFLPISWLVCIAPVSALSLLTSLTLPLMPSLA